MLYQTRLWILLGKTSRCTNLYSQNLPRRLRLGTLFELDDSENRIGRDGGVNGIAPVLEDIESGQGGQGLAGAHHPMAADHGGTVLISLSQLMTVDSHLLISSGQDFPRSQ